MDLIAKLPTIASIIYLNLYRDGAAPCPIDVQKDWSWNFTSMLGYDSNQFTDLIRLYLTIHRCRLPMAACLNVCLSVTAFMLVLRENGTVAGVVCLSVVCSAHCLLYIVMVNDDVLVIPIMQYLPVSAFIKRLLILFFRLSWSLYTVVRSIVFFFFNVLVGISVVEM